MLNPMSDVRRLAAATVVAAVCLLGIGAFNALLYTGLQDTTATNALLLQAGVPALVALLDRWMFGVRVSRMQALGIAASVLGVLAIVFDRVLALAGRACTPWIRGASLRASERRLRALAQALPEVGRLREVVSGAR